MALITYTYQLTPTHAGSAEALSEQPLVVEMIIPDSIDEELLERIAIEMKYEMPYYQYKNISCNCIDMDIDYTYHSPSFVITGKYISVDHAKELEKRFEDIAYDVEVDFWRHEPFLDRKERKYVHERLDKLQQKIEEMCKKMDEKFAEWEELTNEIRSIKPIQPLHIPEPRKLQQTEARQWFHEQAGNATLEERQQIRQWFHEQARKATPEEREAVHKELTMKRDLAKAQEALSKVQQNRGIAQNLINILNKLFHRQQAPQQTEQTKQPAKQPPQQPYTQWYIPDIDKERER